MIVLFVLWMIVIFIGTCTANVDALLYHGEIQFNFTSRPDWSHIYLMYPVNEVSRFEFSGHFLMFFVFAWLLIGLGVKKGGVFLIGLMYAILTEFAQLFFGRGADLYDVLADLIGIIMALFMVWMQEFGKRWEAVNARKMG